MTPIPPFLAEDYRVFQEKHFFVCLFYPQNYSKCDWFSESFSFPQDQNCLFIKSAQLSGHLASASKILGEQEKI